MASTPALSDPVLALLQTLGEELWIGRARLDTVSSLVEALSAIPPERISRAAEALQGSAFLYGFSSSPTAHAPLTLPEKVVWLLHPTIVERRPRYRAELLHLLKRTPRLEYLFLFSSDGYVREAAVKKLAATPSPFFASALALRLNDWVPQVRRAAGLAVARLFGNGEAPVLAEAALFLLARTPLWSRDPAAVSVLSDALTRADVVEALLVRLKTRRDGLALEAQRAAMMSPALDSHLLALATEAVNPAARMIAFDALLRGKVRRRTGFQRQWIDRTFNLYRRTPTFERRSIERPLPLQDLIGLAARDRSAAVRRIAGDILVSNRRDLPDIAPLLALLRNDRSAAIRQRIAFIDGDLGLELHPASGSKAP